MKTLLCIAAMLIVSVAGGVWCLVAGLTAIVAGLLAAVGVLCCVSSIMAEAGQSMGGDDPLVR